MYEALILEKGIVEYVDDADHFGHRRSSGQ